MQYSTTFLFYFMLLLFSCQGSEWETDKQETILAIFAHPDDETIVEKKIIGFRQAVFCTKVTQLSKL